MRMFLVTIGDKEKCYIVEERPNLIDHSISTGVGDIDAYEIVYEKLAGEWVKTNNIFILIKEGYKPEGTWTMIIKTDSPNLPVEYQYLNLRG